MKRGISGSPSTNCPSIGKARKKFGRGTLSAARSARWLGGRLCLCFAAHDVDCQSQAVGLASGQVFEAHAELTAMVPSDHARQFELDVTTVQRDRNAEQCAERWRLHVCQQYV